ncbi:NUDIX domain-containing protein [Candidatus Berkelbacteria bacterium]|nr:NUDIX domain-containing protein [Candidatus Berkelbacteria bacterium]
MIKRHISCGGIVYRRRGNAIQLLFIKNPSGRWTFPKGTPEPGETREHTALREVAEETGITKLAIIKPLGISRYWFINVYHAERGGKLVHKTVHWFLMKGAGTPRHQKEEVTNAQWVDADMASNLKSYRNSAKLIAKALAAIKQ